MAMLISRASGNFTSSSTWGVADSATGSQNTTGDSGSNSQLTTTSYVYSSTFTGTNTRVADGIVLFLKRLNTTGTVTVALSDDNGVTATREVTVNASDLPDNESWVFFKFGTTLTLDGGTDYRVGVKSSDADNARVYRNSTANNWLRIVSTTLAASPAAGDTMLIVGEWTGAGASSSYTVTMDNTNTTDFGSNVFGSRPDQFSGTAQCGVFNGIQICQNGTLTWGTSEATNYYLRVSGNVVTWSGGTYNMGTSLVPCPRSSTMTLEIDSQNVDSTSVFVFSGFGGATVSVYGQSRTAGKNIVQCKLSADAAANATSLTVDTDTGWLDNDEIAIASTSRTNTEGEVGNLNGNAGTSTLTVDGFAGTAGGLAFAHGGTSPIQAEIVNVTRNVVVRTNTNNTGAVSSINFRNTLSLNIHWVQFTSMTSSSAGAQMLSVASLTVRYCSFHNASTTTLSTAISINSLNAVFSDCVFARFRSAGASVGNILTFTNNTIVNTGLTSSSGFTISATGGSVVSNISASGYALSGISLNPSSVVPNIVYENITAHSGAGSGITIGSTTQVPIGVLPTYNNLYSWRNTGAGLNMQHYVPSIFNNCVAFGNGTNSVQVSGIPATTMNNCVFAGDTTFATPSGIVFSAALGINAQFTFNNCQFSPTSGIYVPHTTADINLSAIGTRPMVTLNNTLLGCATEVASPQNLIYSGFIKSSKHDQTEGAFKSWFGMGIVERDTTIFNTAAPSERLTPSSATIKLSSGPRLVAVDDGGTITINAYVRKSATGDGAEYNGNQPRLIVRANLACGITTDTVLDTMTVGTGTWEQLTGTTAAVDADGALEFYVDCDGTAGWVNVDDWTVT